jgi:hypothetical protein
MESYREEIEKEAEEYWRLNRCENKGFLVYELFNGGINSAISERIKIEYAIECLNSIYAEIDTQKSRKVVINKIRELKNKRDGK